MDIILYDEIITTVHNHKGLTTDLGPILQEKYPNVEKGTLESIVSNEWQKIARKCNHKNPEVADRIFNLYMEQREREKESWSLNQIYWRTDRKKILQIATENKMPPTIVARIVLVKFYESQQSNNETEDIKKLTKKNINEMLADSSLIEDLDLCLEVYWATLYDDQYSPFSEFIKHQIGYEYECKLNHFCTMEKMAFKDENKLRKEGYDKTPDIKLELPVLVDGVGITWIESKALFADEEIHKGYIKYQYSSYWNRWGPGLVIYWFGFTKNIINSSEKRFIVRDSFPNSESITHLSYARPDKKTVDDMKFRLSYEAYFGHKPESSKDVEEKNHINDIEDIKNNTCKLKLDDNEPCSSAQIANDNL